jgi:hypothetical protein
VPQFRRIVIDLATDLFDAVGNGAEIRQWLAAGLRRPAAAPHRDDHPAGPLDAHIHAFCLRYEQPLGGSACGVWPSCYSTVTARIHCASKGC